MRAAEVVGRIVESFLGPAPPLHVTCWDDSTWGDERARFRVRINGPSALRRLLWDPNELGLGRAHVAGELDFDGSIFDLFPSGIDAGLRLDFFGDDLESLRDVIFGLGAGLRRPEDGGFWRAESEPRVRASGVALSAPEDVAEHP